MNSSIPDRKRILLIDVDSTIPNIALMKISGYHKKKGDIVGFNVENPDKIYASVIFRKNAHLVDGLKFLYPKAKIDIGGSGYDLKKKLPVEIEHLAPVDYTLYSGNDTFYGFTSRGCIRKCPFCIVPEKEGRFYRSDTVAGIVDQNANKILEQTTSLPFRENYYGVPEGGYKKIVLLDNNILADKGHFMERTQEILDYDLAVDFNQGLDIRLIDSDVANRLKQLTPISVWKFAFDNLAYKKEVLRGIGILNDAGISTRNKTMFYVYMDGDHDFESALERCNILKEHQASAYIMINMDVPRTQRMTDLKRYCLPWIFWSIPFSEYKTIRHHGLTSLDAFAEVIQ